MKHLQADLHSLPQYSKYNYTVPPLPSGPSIAVPLKLKSITTLHYYKITYDHVQLKTIKPDDFLHIRYSHPQCLQTPNKNPMLQNYYRFVYLKMKAYYFRTRDEVILHFALNNIEPNKFISSTDIETIQSKYPEYFI